MSAAFYEDKVRMLYRRIEMGKDQRNQNSTVSQHKCSLSKDWFKIQAEGSDWTSVIIPVDDKTYTEKQVVKLGYDFWFRH